MCLENEFTQNIHNLPTCVSCTEMHVALRDLLGVRQVTKYLNGGMIMRTFLAVLLALIEVEADHLDLSHEERERFTAHTKCLLELLSCDKEVLELIK